MDLLAAAEAHRPRAHGQGLIVMVAAASDDEGVAAACCAAVEDAAAPVFLVDLDVKRSALATHFARTHGLGAPLGASVNGALFCRAKSVDGAAQHESVLVRRAITGTSCHVTQRAATLPADARIQISGDPGYWEALRGLGANVIVAAPSLARAPIALKLAKHMDAIVLVVSGDAHGALPAMQARAALAEAGGEVIGLVFARASAETMAIEQIARRFA